jgi:hypothetical protein
MSLPTPRAGTASALGSPLLDLEHRAEQVRQMKTYEPRRLVIQGVTAAPAVFAAGDVVGGLIVRMLGRW